MAGAYYVSKGREQWESGVVPSLDDRVSALITALGSNIRVIQTLRTPKDQAKAIASGASQWTGDPADAPHPTGHAVDLEPVPAPLWTDVGGWLAWAEDVQAVARNLGLSPRWGGHWSPILDGPPGLLLDSYRAWKAGKGEKPFWDPVHWDFPHDNGGVYMTPAGFRRARDYEVSSAMRQDAATTLAQPLGTFVIRDGYALGVEHHESAERGRHKGVSVFLPSARDIDTLPSNTLPGNVS